MQKPLAGSRLKMIDFNSLTSWQKIFADPLLRWCFIFVGFEGIDTCVICRGRPQVPRPLVYSRPSWYRGLPASPTYCRIKSLPMCPIWMKYRWTPSHQCKEFVKRLPIAEACLPKSRLTCVLSKTTSWTKKYALWPLILLSVSKSLEQSQPASKL